MNPKRFFQLDGVLMDRYQPDHFSESGFWAVVARGFRKSGATVARPALELYYAMKSQDTPIWAKSVALGALGYLIMPLDAVPDFAPFVGFADDAAALMTAVTSIGRYVTLEVKDQAERKANDMFGV